LIVFALASMANLTIERIDHAAIEARIGEHTAAVIASNSGLAEMDRKIIIEQRRIADILQPGPAPDPSKTFGR